MRSTTRHRNAIQRHAAGHGETGRASGITRRRVLSGAAAAGVGVGLTGVTGVWPSRAIGAPAKPDEIIVRAWGGAWLDALKAGVSKPFEAETGIRVRHDTTEDNEIQPKIWSAVQQDRIPPIHVNWDTTTNATKSAIRGVTVDLGDLDNLDGLLPAAKPGGFDGWPIVNAYSYVSVLAYRGKAFPDGAPSSWNALMGDGMQGRIALYSDGFGFIPVAVKLGGGTMDDIPDNMQPAWDYLTKLKKQEPLLGADPNFNQWFQNGEIDAACTVMTNARAARQKGIDVDWTVPKEGCKVDTDSLWVPKNLPKNETYWAKQFVNFALTKNAQKTWCNALGVPPMRPGIDPPEDLTDDPAYPTGEADFANLLEVPDKVLVEHQKDWFARFTTIMKG